VHIRLVGVHKVFCSVRLVCSLCLIDAWSIVQIVQRAAGMSSRSGEDQLEG
jgi:hypothetical protein